MRVHYNINITNDIIHTPDLYVCFIIESDDEASARSPNSQSQLNTYFLLVTS